jgi:hypothetical protein
LEETEGRTKGSEVRGAEDKEAEVVEEEDDDEEEGAEEETGAGEEAEEG